MFNKVKKEFIVRFYRGFVIIFLMILIGIESTGAVNELPFKRFLYVNEWGGTFSSKTSIDQMVSDVKYMNVDSIGVQIGSEYFEAVRDPINKGSWDSRASWNMLEYLITKAHANDIQVHVVLSINSVNSANDAEFKLFGSRFNDANRMGIPDTTIPYRMDLTYAALQDYEAGLIGFIANNYPTLDGILIEEPFAIHISYSDENRARVKAKYNNYDIRTQPADNNSFCSGSSSLGTNQTLCPTNSKIFSVNKDAYYELFKKIRAAFNANKSNPNLLLSASAFDYYRPLHGFDPENASDNGFLDWYVSQNTYTRSLTSFQTGSKSLLAHVNDIPVIPLAGITWTSIINESGKLDTTNPELLNQVKYTCSYGGYAEGIFSHYWRNKKINGTTITAYEGLHNLPPSQLCGQSKIVLAPTFSIPTGAYVSAQNISISTGTTGAIIRYTRDSTTPAETSPIYSTPISISSNTTLKARAWKTGFEPSNITTETYTIAIPAIPTITPANYVNNQGFESGMTSWKFYSSGTGTFTAASPGFEGTKAANLTLNSGGTNIQLYQTGITLEPKTSYRLSFAAYSTSGNDMTVNLIKHDTPYTKYGLGLTVDLGTSWQTFTTKFSTSGFEGNVTDGRFQFWLAPFAEAGDTYYIDDVRLQKVNGNRNIYDVNNDGVVDVYDMNVVYVHLYENTTFPFPNYDLNTDGQVDIFDLILVSSNTMV